MPCSNTCPCSNREESREAKERWLNRFIERAYRNSYRTVVDQAMYRDQIALPFDEKAYVVARQLHRRLTQLTVASVVVVGWLVYLLAH